MKVDWNFIADRLLKAKADRQAGKLGPDCLFKIEMPASGLDKLEKHAATQLKVDPHQFDYMRDPPTNPRRS